ncbi:solute carrier family 35, member F5 [Entomortierella parvispora]|uniref:Solute carrier family 35, member F5 n=1 Tax=Entomortierella parvispora TaxID=205924 RepID=A0A9P3HK09_9FUNG|nr:solute carrier family 35, member F5 [Entomortierella parvispora]
MSRTTSATPGQAGARKQRDHSATRGNTTHSGGTSGHRTAASPTSPPASSRASEHAAELESRRHDAAKRFRLAMAILCICIVSFVLQTELARFVQTSMGYQKPYFILYISHSFWAIALPAQFLYTTQIASNAPRLDSFQDRIDYFVGLIQQSTSSLYHRKNDAVAASGSAEPLLADGTTAFTPREKKALARHLFWITLLMTTLFMVPSYLWYTCVSMTTMSSLTAIYNTSCFFAYLFSVILLKDKIIGRKILAVALSLLGVAVITLATRESPAPDSRTENDGSLALAGNALALIGAALYGFEEVVYKKYCSPKKEGVAFANTLTGLMGVVTFTALWIPIPFLHWIGHEVFELPTRNEFLSILMIAALGLMYNGSFMVLVAQTSPVFAAVGIMATIPVVAVVDWFLFHEAVGWGNAIGGLSIVAGVTILVRENSKVYP